ncbi:TPA: hypothetical protein ACH3X1_001635 [Trebouxia sp. C0004]
MATATAEAPVPAFVRAAAIVRANMRQDPRAAEAMAFLGKPAAEQAALRAAAGKAVATTDKAAAHAVLQEAHNKAAAVAATSHQPVAQSTAKNTAVQSAKAAAHIATADQDQEACYWQIRRLQPSNQPEAAARTAQAEAPAAAADLLSQAAVGTGPPQRAASTSSEGKAPTGNPAAAASSSQPVVKAVAPLQQPAPVSAAAKRTAGIERAAPNGSGEVITQHAPAAQASAQQLRLKPATAGTAF